MYPVLLIAAIAVLVGVVVVAMGRGGELAIVRGDVPEFRFRIRTPADVAMLRLPIGLLGYREPATGDALRAIAGLLAERDAEIAFLRERLALLAPDGQAGSALAEPMTAQDVEPALGSDPVLPAQLTDAAGPDAAAEPAVPS